jgi:hypothetical protein
MVNYDWQGLNYGDYINPPLSVIGRGRHSESIRKQFEADKVAMVEHKQILGQFSGSIRLKLVKKPSFRGFHLIVPIFKRWLPLLLFSGDSARFPF